MYISLGQKIIQEERVICAGSIMFLLHSVDIYVSSNIYTTFMYTLYISYYISQDTSLNIYTQQSIM